MPKKSAGRKPDYIRTKRAKGRTYYYFDTGQLGPNGKPILTRLPDKADLVAFGGALARAHAARTNRVRRSAYLSFEQLKKQFEKSPEFARLADSTKRSYTLYLDRANQLLRDRQGRSPPANAIEPKDVRSIRDHLSETPGAANQTVRALGALYAWASDASQSLVPTNPARSVTRFNRASDDGHAPWPLELVEEALQDRSIRLPVALLYFLGQRIGDTARMGPPDRKGDRICVIQQKTKTPLAIRIHERLAAIIDQDAPRDALVYLISDKGRPLTAGAVRQRIQAWAKAKGHHVVPHGLRKNSVNALLEAGCSTAEVGAITGQDLKTIELYAKRRNQQLLGDAAILKFEKQNGTGK